VDVWSYVVKGLIVGIHVNFNAMLKSATELLDAEDLAREGDLNVAMDVQNFVPTLVENATS
jgi:hypothetical protein